MTHLLNSIVENMTSAAENVTSADKTAALKTARVSNAMMRYVRSDNTVATLIVVSQLLKSSQIDVVKRVARRVDELAKDLLSDISDDQRKRFMLHIVTRDEAKKLHIDAERIYANNHKSSNAQILGKNKALQTTLYTQIDEYAQQRTAQLASVHMLADKYIDLERFCDASNNRIVASTLDVARLDDAQLVSTEQAIAINDALAQIETRAELAALENEASASVALAVQSETVVAESTAKKTRKRKLASAVQTSTELVTIS